MLYQDTLGRLAKFLAAKLGADEGESPRFSTYLQAVFFGQYPADKISARTASELRTLARALDELGTGALGAVGDVLVQPFKALESSVKDGSWNVARRQLNGFARGAYQPPGGPGRPCAPFARSALRRCTAPCVGACSL